MIKIQNFSDGSKRVDFFQGFPSIYINLCFFKLELATVIIFVQAIMCLFYNLFFEIRANEYFGAVNVYLIGYASYTSEQECATTIHMFFR